MKVTKLADYGAFVEFEGGYSALLHISEISRHRARPRPAQEALTLTLSTHPKATAGCPAGCTRASRLTHSLPSSAVVDLGWL